MRPQRTKMGKFFSWLGKILVKINHNTVIMISGLAKDHPTPRDMLRYRTRKSFMSRVRRTKPYSPSHFSEMEPFIDTIFYCSGELPAAHHVLKEGNAALRGSR